MISGVRASKKSLKNDAKTLSKKNMPKSGFKIDFGSHFGFQNPPNIHPGVILKRSENSEAVKGRRGTRPKAILGRSGPPKTASRNVQEVAKEPQRNVRTIPGRIPSRL